MAISASVKKSFTFVAGLNTEGGELVNPPNSWVEGDNVVPATDGSIQNREAIDLEPGYAYSSIGLALGEKEQSAYHTGEWRSVGGNSNKHFLIVQNGRYLHFYNNAGASISATEKAFTVDLYNFKGQGASETVGARPCDFTTINGRLLVVNVSCDPFLIEYDASGDTISTTLLTLKIRDFIGADDGLAVTARPSTLSDEHHYNLLNQGWTTTHINTYFATHALYPSNADIWQYAKDGTDDFDEVLMNKLDFGNSPAPRGKYVLDVFRSNRGELTGFTLPNVIVPSRPSTCTFYAGRAWYAGQESPTIGSYIYFSKVIDEAEDAEKCHSDNDPTAEIINDLLDSDGGYIVIADSGTVYAMRAFDKFILVFAENGVWAIGGTATLPFAANSYEVIKISNVGIRTRTALVATPNGFVMWADDGIYTIAYNENKQLAVLSVSADKVQTLYENIPEQHRPYAQGTYNPADSTVYWIYQDDDNRDATSDRYVCNRILCVDISLGAFFTHTIGSVANGPEVVGVFTTRPRTTDTAVGLVYNSSNAVVQDSSPADVTVNEPIFVFGDQHVMFLVVALDGTYKVTFAEFGTLYDESFDNLLSDWEDVTEASWSFTNATSSMATPATAPDGVSDGGWMQATAGVAEHSMWQDFTAATDSVNYTASVWVKAAQATKCFMRVRDKAGVSVTSYFDLATGDMVDGATSSITLYSNGWYRIAMTVNSASGGTSPRVTVGPVDAMGNVNYTGTGAGIDLYTWGWKANIGSSPLKFKPAAAADIEVLRDWYRFNQVGIGFVPYFTTGYDFPEQGADRFIQSQYIMTYLRRTVSGTDSNGNDLEPSSVLLRGRWEWSDTNAGNKWSAQQQIYRPRRAFMSDPFSTTFNDGTPLLFAKSKVRGRGHVLQLNITGEVDKKMVLIGWSVLYTASNDV